MTEEAKVELLPAIIGSEQAPLIFANGILNFGVAGGVANLLLATRRDVVHLDGKSESRLLVTADLRIPLADLGNFRDTLDKLMLTAVKPQGQA